LLQKIYKQGLPTDCGNQRSLDPRDDGLAPTMPKLLGDAPAFTNFLHRMDVLLPQ